MICFELLCMHDFYNNYIYNNYVYLYIEGAENQGQHINSTWNNIIYISFYQLQSLSLP